MELIVSEMIEHMDLQNMKVTPYVMPNQCVFASGVHNSVTYSTEEINKVYTSTNWKDKRVISLYLDHRDDWAVDPRTGRKTLQTGASVTDWIGEMRNIKQRVGSLYADIYIVDYATAAKLKFGAKFGISPAGHWSGENTGARDFVVRNFAMVVNPAIKQNYCNNFAMTSEIAMDDNLVDKIKMDLSVEELKAGIDDAIKPIADMQAKLSEKIVKLESAGAVPPGLEPKDKDEDEEKKKKEEKDKEKEMDDAKGEGEGDQMSAVLSMVASSTELATKFTELKGAGKSISDIHAELSAAQTAAKDSEMADLKTRLAALEEEKAPAGEGEGEKKPESEVDPEKDKLKAAPTQNQENTDKTTTELSSSIDVINQNMADWLMKGEI